MARSIPPLHFAGPVRYTGPPSQALHNRKALSDIPGPFSHDLNACGSLLTNPDTASTKPLPLLPVELIERIAEFLFEPVPPAEGSLTDVSMLCTKPTWPMVKGFMEASPDLHKMGYTRWMRVITVRLPEDWSIISQHLSLIREIRCLDNTLLDIKHQRLLSAFPHLYSATIDAHSDVHRGDNHRFAYRDVIATLPPSLKRLEIIHAHGPDIRVISTVKKYCPHLEELRLGRCTMFNRVPACDFWASFPHDHDAYISSSETNSYSDSLGQELAPLKNLRSLRMGLYLSPSNIVLGHKLYHRRGIAAPETIVWQTAIPLSELPRNPFTQDVHPHLEHATTEHLVSILHRPDSEPNTAFDCPWCIEATADISKATETAANAILRQHVPSLSKIQWMGWLTPGHLGVNSYEFPGLLEKSMMNI